MYIETNCVMKLGRLSIILIILLTFRKEKILVFYLMTIRFTKFSVWWQMKVKIVCTQKKDGLICMNASLDLNIVDLRSSCNIYLLFCFDGIIANTSRCHSKQNLICMYGPK